MDGLRPFGEIGLPPLMSKEYLGVRYMSIDGCFERIGRKLEEIL
jgi:hypothetical protein